MKRYLSTIGFLFLLNSSTSLAATLSYTYDAAGRLVGVAYDSGITVSYTYDLMGNRTRKVVTIPPTLDTDGDGVPDLQDTCPFDPNDPLGDPCNHTDCADRSLQDSVGDACNHDDCSDRSARDGVADPCNHDEDGDGFADSVDLFPFDRLEWADTDGDGVGDNADTDDDNDGIPDSVDRFPLAANRAPVVTPMGDQALNEGESLSLQVIATDPDNDPLLFRAENLPPGSSFDTLTQIFSWSPDYDQAGLHEGIRFTASEDYLEGALEGSTEISISVAQTNRPPVLSPLEDQTVNEMESVSFFVSGEDPDQDLLTFSAENLPDGALFNPESREFTWQPTRDQQGVYPITFVVDDGELADRRLMTITVIDDGLCLDGSGQDAIGDPCDHDDALPDLVIQSTRIARTGGRLSRLEVTLLNRGHVAASGPIHLGGRPNWYRKPGFNDVVMILRRGEDLPPNETVSGTFYWPAAESWQMTVDPRDRIDEIDEENNNFLLQ